MISVSTISFNQAKFLPYCVGSVQAAALRCDQPVEHIVVDALSTDGSQEILKSQRNIEKLIIEGDKGPAAGLNKAFAHAKGEIGYYVNADDAVVPEAFKRMNAAWKKYPHADIILGGAWMIDKNGALIGLMRSKKVTPLSLIDQSRPLVQLGMSFKMEMFRSVGGFNEQNKTCWDLELLLEMLQNGAKVIVLRDVFGKFRLHREGLSGGAGGVSHRDLYIADLNRLKKKYVVQKNGVSQSWKAFEVLTSAIKKINWIWKTYIICRRIFLYPFWILDN